MSYALHAYMVDIKAIDSVFNSQDEALQNALVASQKNKLQALREIVDSELSPIEALKNIFAGDLYASFDAVMYAHVCELICSHLGEALPCSEWQDLSMNWLMDVNMQPCLPIAELPLPSDFPYVLTIPYKELEDFVDIMGALDLEEDAPWLQFEGWVKKLHTNKADLVVFFY